MPERAAAARTTSQSTFGDVPSPQIRPALLIARKTRPLVMAAAMVQASTAELTHCGMATALPDKIGDHPVFLSLLDRLQREGEQLSAA